MGTLGVIVLGPGRSGTSAIASAFVEAGFFAGGKDDLFGPGAGNPLGHYESLAVLEVNEELLDQFGCKWWADAPSPEEQLPHRATVVPRLRAILESLMVQAEDAPVVVKEPRINGLLPLWGPAIEEILHPVLAVRDPLEVALSHTSRDGTPIGHALAAWEAQTALVLDWLNGRTATIAPYAQLTARPQTAARLIHDAASHLEPPRAGALRPQAAGSVLRRDPHRQKAGELAHSDYLTGRQAALWDYLKALPAGDVQVEIPAWLGEQSQAARKTMRLESERIELLEVHAGLVRALSETREREAELHRRLAGTIADAASAAQRNAEELASITASTSWRITAPLRRTNGVLRRRPGPSATQPVANAGDIPSGAQQPALR